MEEEEKFRMRCYGKSELALLYFPELSDVTAMRKLNRWIKKCTALWEEVSKKEYAYNAKKKTYTAREVRLIIHYLGEP